MAKIERKNTELRELVDDVVDRVLELARHPSSEGDGDRELRGLLESFQALTDAELAEREHDDEWETDDDDDWEDVPYGPCLLCGGEHDTDEHLALEAAGKLGGA